VETKQFPLQINNNSLLLSFHGMDSIKHDYILELEFFQLVAPVTIESVNKKTCCIYKMLEYRDSLVP
jgi:hypothetical protein